MWAEALSADRNCDSSRARERQKEASETQHRALPLEGTVIRRECLLKSSRLDKENGVSPFCFSNGTECRI